MGWWHSKNFYKSGKEPVYKVGQVVFKMWRYYNETCLSMMQFSCEHEIIEVSEKKSGFIFREFTYKVKFLESGKKFKSIYESQLAKEQQRAQYSDSEIGDPFPSDDAEDK